MIACTDRRPAGADEQNTLNITCHPTRVCLTRFLAAVLLAPGLVSPAVSGDLELVHDGIARTYQLYVPSSYSKDVPVPLLVVLHGRSGNGESMATLTEFNVRADEHGFIVVYPDGVDNAWNYVHGIPATGRVLMIPGSCSSS